MRCIDNSQLKQNNMYIYSYIYIYKCVYINTYIHHQCIQALREAQQTTSKNFHHIHLQHKQTTHILHSFIILLKLQNPIPNHRLDGAKTRHKK